MTEPGERAFDLLTLCLVIQSRSGNLANALHSVNKVASRSVIVHAGGGGSQMVEHLASEYDAQYLRVPADTDESSLLNTALDQVRSPWALFLNQQEVLHTSAPETLLDWLTSAASLAIDFPIVSFDEPRNYYFDTRLIRTDRALRWEHEAYPTLDASLDRAARESGIEQPTVYMPHGAIISLGPPEPGERELRDTIIQVERVLDKNPKLVRYWYHLAVAAKAIKDWERANAAVEEGLTVVSTEPDIPRLEPMAVCGLIAMLCESLLAAQYYPEKTVESLWVIFGNMEGNGRLSVLLGRLLLAAKRPKDAIKAQYMAVENFFHERRYYLSMEEGLYNPIMSAWEMELALPRSELIKSTIRIQTLFDSRKFKMQRLLQFVSNSNQALFTALSEAVQLGLSGRT